MKSFIVKTTSLLLASTLFLCTSIITIAQETPRVIIDGNEISFNTTPQLVNESVYCTLEDIIDFMKIRLEYYEDTKYYLLMKNDIVLAFQENNPVVTKNEVPITFKIKSILINEKESYSIKELAEIFDASVTWNNATNTLTIINPNIEWIYGGYESDEPFKEYEIKYINGVASKETRYNGKNHEISRVNLFSWDDGRILYQIPKVDSYNRDGWLTSSPFIGKTYWINAYAFKNYAVDWTLDNSLIYNENTNIALTMNDLFGSCKFGKYVKVQIFDQIINEELSNLYYPNFNPKIKIGEVISPYDSLITAIINDKYHGILRTECLSTALREEGMIPANYIDKHNKKYLVLTQSPNEAFNWNQQTWNKLSKGNLWIGMNTDMFLVLLNRLPDRINRTTGSYGVFEQWVYDYDSFSDEYYYFDNGILTSWQD